MRWNEVWNQRKNETRGCESNYLYVRESEKESGNWKKKMGKYQEN